MTIAVAADGVVCGLVGVEENWNGEAATVHVFYRRAAP